MNSSCQHVLCGLVDFSKKLPDNIVKVRKGMTFFVERSALYSLSILKLAVLTSSPNPKEEYLEWWEFGDSPFRGVVRFGDDEFDSRTVCADISIAEAVFKELYETGGLDVGLAQMRSPWNPRP
ncbi:hypothetical protein LSP16_32475 [Pseudomonas aeruginosa]|uniref:hypothetical protein n=1 Tax=Pseudomonas aeruginosa TaxID=287 RepID=UPI001F5B2BFB|nr:hypothetical protein [Pseudomonas aeruginosa]UJT96813.1 hypothetical protein LSP16_32475 [Pseudomonas aeruginosa]